MSALPLEEFLLRQLASWPQQDYVFLATPSGFNWPQLVKAVSSAQHYNSTQLKVFTNDWRCQQEAQALVAATYFTFPAPSLNFFSSAISAKTSLTSSNLLFWPKAKEEGYWWLAHLAGAADAVILLGENNAGVKAAAKKLQLAGAEVEKLDSARRCSSYSVTGLSKLQTWLAANFAAPKWEVNLAGQKLILANQPGIFSQGRLDAGSQLLLETLEANFNLLANNLKTDLKTDLKNSLKPNLKKPLHALDLGCGNGVLGAWLLKNLPHLNLTATDVNGLALTAAQATFAANNLQADLCGADIFTGLNLAENSNKFALILSNPPFHTGKATDYELAARFIAQAPEFLTKGGHLWLVANSFLPYPELLDKAFGKHQLVAATTKFCVYLAIKK